jgi:hypothetical protein
MRFLVLPFLLSVLGTFLTLRLFGGSKLWHHHSSRTAPQALHFHPVPRLGSVGIGFWRCALA